MKLLNWKSIIVFAVLIMMSSKINGFKIGRIRYNAKEKNNSNRGFFVDTVDYEPASHPRMQQNQQLAD